MIALLASESEVAPWDGYSLAARRAVDKETGSSPMPRTSSRASKPPKTAQEPAWSIPSLREPRYSQSLERGLAILGCFTPKRPVLGIADIADELGMSRSTTHRYVITLARARLSRAGRLAQVPPRPARDRPGDVRAQLDRPARARAPLSGGAAPADLLHGQPGRARRTGDPVRRPRAQLSSRPEARSTSTCIPARACPRYCTAMGKLLLANLPDATQRDLFASMKLTKRGPNTITSKKALRDELERGAGERASRSTTRSSRPSSTRSPRPCATRAGRWSPRSTCRRTAR